MEILKRRMNLNSHFTDFLNVQGIDLSQTYLVGLSGGPDSMVLLHLCYNSGLKLVVAHVNYQLRAGESDLDEEFVVEACRRMNLPFEVLRAGTLMQMPGEQGSVQMRAREIRMNFFERLAAKYNASGVFLGNHADDQVEGFFLSIMQQKSLAGMPANDGFKIRPFLHVWKDELIAFARQNAIEYREDSGNYKPVYERNKIRLELIPRLTEFRPGFKQEILESVKRQFSEKQTLESLLEQHFKNYLNTSERGFYLSKDAFSAFIDPLPALSFLFRKLDVSGRFLRQIAKNLTNTHHTSFFATGLEVHIDRYQLSVLQIVTNNNSENTSAVPCIITEKITKKDLTNLNFSNLEAILNPALLEHPLLLRKWRKGDKFCPSGMKGSKLLSDFFTDQKFSKTQKEDQWLLCCGENIVWVVNQRVDERFRYKPGGFEALRIRIEQS